MPVALHRLQHEARHRRRQALEKRIIVLPSERRAPQEQDGAEGLAGGNANDATQPAEDDNVSKPSSDSAGVDSSSDASSSSATDTSTAVESTSSASESSSSDNSSEDTTDSESATETTSSSDILSDIKSDTTKESTAVEASNSSDEGSSDSTGLIIGIVSAILVVLALGVGFWLLKRKRRLQQNRKDHTAANLPPSLSYRGGSVVVNDMDDFDKQSKAGGEQSSYFDEHPGQDMAYAPQGSQHATFGNQLPPRPPADAAQDPAHVKRGTGGWFKDRRTPSPEQGSLFPPTRDSAYGQSVKESLRGVTGGGLTMAEAFTNTSSNNHAPSQQPRGGLTMAEQYANPSAQSRGSPPATGHRGGGGLTMAEQYTREGASTQPPAPLQSRAGGLTMAQNYAEPSASGFESQSGYERSEVPSAPGPDYYNSSAGSNFGRAPAPNGQSSSSRSQSRSRSDRQQTHFVPSSSAPAVPTMNQTQLPGYPPRSVKSTAPTGILKNEGVGASYSSPSVPQVGQSRSRNHQPMDSDVSERTQAVGSFLDDYTAKSSSVGASSVVQAVGSPPPGQGHGQSPYGFSEFSEQSSSSGLGPTQPRSGRSGPGPRVAVPPSQAATTINGSLAPPPNRR